MLEHIRSHLIILILVSLTFGNALWNGFVGDDEIVIVKNDFYKSIHNLKRLFDESYITHGDRLSDSGNHDYGSGSVSYRPILTLTYFLDHAIWGLKPFGYHLTNVLLHLANALLVYWLFFLVLKDVPQSVFGALIFALHPLKTEAVCSIGYRADILSSFFIILSLFCYILAKREEFNKAKYLMFSFVFFGLGLFSKESVLSFAALFPLYDYFFLRQDMKTVLRNNVKVYGGYLILILIYLYLYMFIFRNSSLLPAHLMGGELYKHVGNIFIIFGEYMLAFFNPFAVKTLPPLYRPLFDEFWAYQVCASILLFLATAGYCLWSIQRKNMSAFFLIWFFITLIPVFNIIPIANPMAHRFMYLPSVGLSAWLAVLILKGLKETSWAKNKPNLIKIIKISFLLACVLVTIPLNTRWKNSAVMAMSMLKSYPQDPAGYLFSGQIMMEAGQFDAAKHLLLRGLSLGLNDPRAFYYLGILFDRNKDESERYFNIGVNRFPKHGLLHTGYGRNLLFKGKIDAAEKILQQAVQLNPTYTSYGYLIQSALLKGQRKKAEVLLNEALPHIAKDSHRNSLIRFFAVDVKVLPVDIGI